MKQTQPRLLHGIGKPRLLHGIGKPRLPHGIGKPRLPHGIGKPRLPPDTGKPRLPPDIGKPRLPPDIGKPRLPPDTGKPRLLPDTGKPRLLPDTGKPHLLPDIVNTLQQCLDGRIGLRTSLVYIIRYVETGEMHERLHVVLNDFRYSREELSDIRTRDLSRWDILKEVIPLRTSLRTSLVYIIRYVETGEMHERLHVGLNDFRYSREELSDIRTRGLSRWDIAKEVISRRAPRPSRRPETISSVG